MKGVAFRIMSFIGLILFSFFVFLLFQFMNQGRSILSHDVVFWLGDFNYRITLSREEAELAIKSGNILELSRYDQLLQQKALGEVCVVAFSITKLLITLDIFTFRHSHVVEKLRIS